MRQEPSCIHEHGVPAGGLHGGYTERLELLGDVLARSDPVSQVVLVDDFLESRSDGFQIAPSKAAVGREPLRQDETVSCLDSLDFPDAKSLSDDQPARSIASYRVGDR